MLPLKQALKAHGMGSKCPYGRWCTVRVLALCFEGLSPWKRFSSWGFFSNITLTNAFPIEISVSYFSIRFEPWSQMTKQTRFMLYSRFKISISVNSVALWNWLCCGQIGDGSERLLKTYRWETIASVTKKVYITKPIVSILFIFFFITNAPFRLIKTGIDSEYLVQNRDAFRNRNYENVFSQNNQSFLWSRLSAVSFAFRYRSV